MSNEVFPIKSKRDFNRMKKAMYGRDQMILTLGTAFGLRISDLLQLKVGDLRGKESLTVVESKRGKKRVITFSPSVKRIARELEGDDSDYIFESRKRGPNGESRPISRTRAWEIINDAAERAGIKDKIGNIGGHTMRKTFGYRLYQQGINITRIMAILGHSSEKETLRYIGVTADEIADAYKAIDV